MEIYSFGLNQPVPAEAQSAEVLGGKGYGLVWMDSLGVNVPPGFILPCSLMTDYQKSPEKFMKAVAKEIQPWLKRMADHFGYMPLVSVRSGARQSMPGMMDTILNVGLEYNSAVWAKKLGEACATNSELRLITMFSSVVKGLDKKEFHRCSTVDEARIKYTELTGEQFPAPQAQLLESIEAVFKSWFNERAKIYRKMNNIPEDWGTAVVVQAMVFGNMNDHSGTGVLFTRNPDTGEDKLVGEFAINAQGEDVVDGSTTPMQLSKMKDWNYAVADQLAGVAEKLEEARKDVQDMEFTVQDNKLYILQTRTAKRTPGAALRIAVEMFDEGLIDAQTVLSRVDAKLFDQAQQVVIDPTYDKPVYANGTAACSGVVCGIVVNTAQAAIDCAVPCILVTQETNPDDIGGMYAARGIITMTGGHTCHAAVVARGMNKPCIVGVGMTLDKFPAGMTVAIDGATGRIWNEQVPVIDGSKNPYANRYISIMRQHFGYVPIVTGPDAGIAKIVMYKPSATALNLALDCANVVHLLEQCERVYVDMRAARIDPAERQFYRLFQQEPPALDNGQPYPYGQLYAALAKLKTADRARLVVLGIQQVTKPMGSITEVNTLEDLINMEGQGVLGGIDLTDKAVKKVLGWRKDDPEFIFVNYGMPMEGSSTSFASDVLAMQHK